VTTPFIQVTWDGTEAPIRHTTSLAGAALAFDELVLEPHPAAAPATATTAPTATAALLRFTTDLLSGLSGLVSWRKTNRKLSY
jgi:hypothetical protein